MFVWQKIEPDLQAKVLNYICRINKHLTWKFMKESDLSIGELKKITRSKASREIGDIADERNLNDDYRPQGPHKVETAKWCFEVLVKRNKPDIAKSLHDALGQVGQDALEKCSPGTRESIISAA